MTLTLQEISDRLEIAETITRYSHGLDQRAWSVWGLTFTPDAVIDFSFWGIAPASPAELKQQFSANDATRISGQHLLSNQIISIDGDAASAHTEYNLTTLSYGDAPATATRNRGGGYYEDDLVRTADGWRIRHRRGVGKWHHQDQIAWPAISATSDSSTNSPKEPS